jgi:hypothetical protein
MKLQGRRKRKEEHRRQNAEVGACEDYNGRGQSL